MGVGLAVGCEEVDGGWVGCRGVSRPMEAGLAVGCEEADGGWVGCRV